MTTLQQLFDERKVEQFNDEEYPYIKMYGTIEEIIKQADALVRGEVLEEVENRLKKEQPTSMQYEWGEALKVIETLKQR